MSPNIYNKSKSVKMNNNDINDQSHSEHLFCSLDQTIVISPTFPQYYNSKKEILLRVAEIVDSKDILLITHCSLGYLIFLKTEKVTKELHASKSININNKQYYKIVRPFIPNRILIRFENMLPLIPHGNIQKAFEKLGIYSVQYLSFVNVDYEDPALCHILSGDREGSILYSDIDKIKENIINIEFENMIHKISFKIKCPIHTTEYHDPDSCQFHPTKVMASFCS